MGKGTTQKGIKAFIIGIILLCLVLGFYYYLSNKKRTENAMENVKATVVQEILMRDLENDYPPTPREVVKYYGEITQCFYGEEYTQEELQELAEQIQGLYDEELVANKTKEQYLADLTADINSFKEQGMLVSSYSPASSTDVYEFTQDGYSWARMRCTFSLRKGTELKKTEEIFLLRKDDKGHWKIYGWILAPGYGDMQIIGGETGNVPIDIGEAPKH